MMAASPGCRKGQRVMEQESRRLTLSVIIASCNRPNELQKTVEDLSVQSHLPDEILVIDQSTVQAPDEPKLGLRFQPCPKVRYIHQQPPHAQRARNLGIQLA